MQASASNIILKLTCTLIIIIFSERRTTVLPLKNVPILHCIHLNENSVFYRLQLQENLWNLH